MVITLIALRLVRAEIYPGDLRIYGEAVDARAALLKCTPAQREAVGEYLLAYRATRDDPMDEKALERLTVAHERLRSLAY